MQNAKLKNPPARSWILFTFSILHFAFCILYLDLCISVVTYFIPSSIHRNENTSVCDATASVSAVPMP